MLLKQHNLQKMKYKRFQYYSKEGIKWSNWFIWDSTLMDKWQLKDKLLNEYKEV